jgi:acyl transferase domain-containing protein
MEFIAIVGIGFRFPGAKTPESFWKLLSNGMDVIGEVPCERWNAEAVYATERGIPAKTVSRWGGFIEQMDYFDADFFEIPEREVSRIDPHQKILLEVAWESLENANIVPETLAGSQAGVFIGMSQSDHNRLIYRNLSDIKADDGTNTYACLTANRLSYCLNLQGPSLVIDSACSSSLVALHYACQSLRGRECNLALAGGVNVLLSPEEFISFSHKGMLSAEGRCKTFDATADGYVRSEGCGVFVLKRLADALEAGDNILATIRGSAVNQNGLNHAVTAPNGLAQQRVINQALKNAGVAPEEISYVELHGTGTYLGDVIEYKALKAELMKNRNTNQPCWLGCVKTNIGHLEAASGAASLIKTILSLQHQSIPANLHLKELNPLISLEGTTFSMPKMLQPWTSSTEKRLAGISTFGFGGTNAHLILEEAPVSPNVLTNQLKRPLHLLSLSAKTEKALKELASGYLEKLQDDFQEIPLADICFTANHGRTHFEHRLAVVVDSHKTLGQHLEAFLSGIDKVGLVKGRASPRKSSKVAFLFPNQDQRYVEMGRQLYETQPTFRTAIEHCDEILRPYLETSLIEVLYPQKMGDKKVAEAEPHDLTHNLQFPDSLYAQSALFAVEYALSELWKSWGVNPSVVMGSGTGEYVAACVAGVFRLEDALKLLVQRQPLGAAMAGVTFSPPSIAIVSSVTGKLATGSIANSDYWLKLSQQPVQLAEGIQTLYQNGYEVFIHLGFKGSSLEKMSYNHLLEAGQGVCLSSLERGQTDWQSMLLNLGELYVRGLPVSWLGFDQDYRRCRVNLPTYPFQRQHFPMEVASATDSSSELSSSEHFKALILQLLNQASPKYFLQLWSKEESHFAQGTINQHVQSLSPEQAKKLLIRAVQLLREKDVKLSSSLSREKLRQQIKQINEDDSQELLINALELLKEKDDLVKACLSQEVLSYHLRHLDPDQIREILVSMTELLKREEHIIRVSQGNS